MGIFLTGVNPMELESQLHIEWWGNPYQYSGMTTQLFWVFNQAIPAWVCTMLIYVQKNNRNIVFILACSMLSSTFPFVGLLALALFLCFSRKYEGKYLSSLIEDTATVQNAVGGGIVGITTFLYLSSNYSGSVIMGENIRGPEFENSLPKLIIFLILEIGVYGVLLYKYNQENKLFYFIMLCLCIIPPVKVGFSNDFCMRASIPALLLLMILVIKAVEESWKKKDYRVFAGLMLVMVVGSVTPVCEFKRTLSETFRRIKQDEIVYAEDTDMLLILNECNFAGNIDGNIFFEYLAR